MKYENAKDILPQELLKEVQKYAAGRLIYVPLGDEKRSWGEASGYRAKLQKRNYMICCKYANGMTISELAEEYFLSLDSIKKIVYCRKNNRFISFAATLTSAVEYSNAGMIEEWVHSFLLSDCNGSVKSDRLMEKDFIYFGVAKLPLRLVQENYTIEANISKEAEVSGQNSADMPPLIIEFNSGKFYALTQTEMFMALKSLKVNAYPAFIIIDGKEDYKTFMKNYGRYLIIVDRI